MILVSFSSAEDVWFNDVTDITLSARKVLKIHRSAFSGTPGIIGIGHFMSEQNSTNKWF